jgi:hypothetical protein
MFRHFCVSRCSDLFLISAGIEGVCANVLRNSKTISLFITASARVSRRSY